MAGTGNGLWKSLFFASLATNVTGITAWMTLSHDVVTATELDKAISNAPYPWIADRGLVMQHVTGAASIHETDGQKRTRIREELTPIREELAKIREELKRLK